MSISKYHVSKNLYNTADTSWTNGYLDNDGQLVSSSISHFTTNFTEVEANTTYTWSGTITESSTSANNVYFYDGSQNWISKASSGVISPRTFTTPSNCRYIRFQVTRGVSSTDDWVLNKGNSALPYEPYGDSFKDWFYREYGTETETFTSLPKTIIGDGQPISAYTIKGNMTQSGTPTPSNPVYPQETGDKTANLLDYHYIFGNDIYSEGVTFRYYRLTLEPNTQYTLISNAPSYYSTSSPSQTTFLFGDSSSLTTADNGVYDSIAKTATSTAEGYLYIAVRKTVSIISQVTEEDFADGTYYIMLNTGSTSLPYEPYGYKIPISFGQGTYTNYLSEPIRKIGTAVDSMASTGTATRTITKYEFTGNESITKVNSTATNYLYYISFTGTAIGGAMCSHLQYLSSGVSDNIGFSQNQTYPNTFYFNLGADIMNAQTSGNTAEGFKEWLAAQYAAGTPLTLWRILATPTTETFTAPSIPTSGTAQSFDVSTSLKPSEVSLTYHGWHEHSDKKYSRTAQLIYGKIDNCAISETGVLDNSSSNDMLLAQIESGKTYSLSTAAYVGFFYTEPSKGDTSYDNVRTLVNNTNVTAPITGYIAIRASHSTSNVMFNEGSTLLPYQPYYDWS